MFLFNWWNYPQKRDGILLIYTSFIVTCLFALLIFFNHFLFFLLQMTTLESIKIQVDRSGYHILISQRLSEHSLKGTSEQ